MVKQLNRRVTVIVPGVTQNDQGGNEATTIDSWVKWAHVENRTGSNSFQNQQQTWQYDYKVIMRYEATRPTKSNYEIEYENYRLKVESVEIDSEGYKGYEILRCSKIDEFITDGNSS